VQNIMHKHARVGKSKNMCPKRSRELCRQHQARHQYSNVTVFPSNASSSIMAPQATTFTNSSNKENSTKKINLHKVPILKDKAISADTRWAPQQVLKA
jgi:hypothetical protein